MEHIKSIYFNRHLYKFEDVFCEKYILRNINDLNGFLCCLCCIIPFGVFKATLMCFIHLLILIPFMLIVSVILFPYQLITIYITTLSTVLLGPKIKCILFVTNCLLYSLFIVFYLAFAILSCIYFSFYAAFKVTLSDNYYVFGGYIDPLKVLFSNIWIYLLNNTNEFKKYCKHIENYVINEDIGDQVWDISFIAWCNTLMGIIMTVFAVIFIYSFVFIEIILYFIPFSIHLMINLYVFKFLSYYIKTMIIKQPCLALIGLPFIIVPILLIPIFAALYLICYVWLYSSFFNKAIIMQSYIDNAFDCLQQLSYIINTIILYNNSLCKYSFQSCWKCHCLQTLEKPENDGFDLEKQANKSSKDRDDHDEYDPYEIKFRQLSAIFWETKNNSDLVTFGKKKTEQEIQKKRQQKMEKEEYQRQQLNIERWHSINVTKPKVKQVKNGHNNNQQINGEKKKKNNLKTRQKRVHSDSLSFDTKSKHKKLNKKKHKYEHIDMSRVAEEDITDSEELNVLMTHNEAYNAETNASIGFSYPRGI